MSKRVIYLCIGVLSLSCCHSRKEVNVDIPTTYTINVDSINESSDLEYCINTIIPLNTDFETPINDISRLIFRNGMYFLFDRANKTILTFDTLGNMIEKKHSIGNGPGEFIDPWDFDVDEQSNIWVYDLPTAKLIKYPHKDNNIGITEYKIGKQMLFISVADSCTLYGSYIYENGELKTWLGQFTLDDIHYTPIITNKEMYDLSYINSKYFFRSLDNLYYYNKHGEYIYKLNSNSILPYIRIESCCHPTKEDLIECQKNGHSLTLLANNKVGEVNAVYETEDYIFVEIAMNIPGYYIIDKKDGTITRMKFDVDMDFNGHLKVVGSTGKHFVGYYPINENNLKHMRENLDNKINGYHHISNITEDSDPVLVLFNFTK